MEVLPGQRLLDVGRNAIDVFVAAPYIKDGALKRVLAVASPRLSLTCITRWNPHELALGISDSVCRTTVQRVGGSFRLHPSLHAKYYRMNNVVLVGSANLTLSGMGWARESNLEVLCRAGDDFDPEGFERQLLNESREVTEGEFLYWDAIANIDDSIPVSGRQPQLDDWRPITRNLRDLELAYEGRQDEIASLDQKEAAIRDIAQLGLPPGFTLAEVRAWALSCLLSTSFANSVMRIPDTTDVRASYGFLAETYSLSMTEARRAMEAVRNWLAFLSHN